MGIDVDEGFRRAWALNFLTRTYRAQDNHRERCGVCGFRIRGPNHEAGKHHALKHPKLRVK